jgi:hypothetical protein
MGASVVDLDAHRRVHQSPDGRGSGRDGRGRPVRRSQRGAAAFPEILSQESIDAAERTRPPKPVTRRLAEVLSAQAPIITVIATLVAVLALVLAFG